MDNAYPRFHSLPFGRATFYSRQSLIEDEMERQAEHFGSPIDANRFAWPAAINQQAWMLANCNTRGNA